MTGQKIPIYLVKFYRHWKHLHSNVFVMTQYLNITMYNKLLPDLNKQSSIRPSYPQQWYSHYTVTTQGNSFRRKKLYFAYLKICVLCSKCQALQAQWQQRDSQAGRQALGGARRWQLSPGWQGGGVCFMSQSRDSSGQLKTQHSEICT